MRRLAGEGVSVRRVAELVFGDSRYRGRVERIVRAAAGPEGGPSDRVPRRGRRVRPGEELVALRAVIEQAAARLLDRDLSVREIASLARLYRELEARQTLERLNALTREPSSDGRPS